ncbi:hypothetical protein [Streptomyces sp. NBC_00212]|uniref:hypothetical protein n=1 Tax=Streptomyces sp. NBC_00212 TaxID=2975684 RepID=UPI0032447074
MAYDIMFLRVLPGRTFDEALEEVNSAYDPDAGLRLMTVTGVERGVWDRLVRALPPPLVARRVRISRKSALSTWHPGGDTMQTVDESHYN